MSLATISLRVIKKLEHGLRISLVIWIEDVVKDQTMVYSWDYTLQVGHQDMNEPIESWEYISQR